MAATPEGVTKDDIKALLDSYGDELYYCMPVQQGYGKRLVDFYICYRGLFIAIEAKRRGARAKKFQALILDEVRDAGGEALSVDTVEQLQELLDYIKGLEFRLVDRVARPRTQSPDLSAA